MEIRRWHCYVYIAINCAVLPCITAKSISLNEIIAAENQKKQALGSTLEPKIRETTDSFTQNTTPTKAPWIKLRKLKAKYIPLDKKISLKYKKAFDINSPLKPSKLKYKLNKLRNQSNKREISNNEDVNRKYTPLFRNIAVLFSNLLNTGDSETVNIINNRKYKRNKNHVKNSGMVCTCTRSGIPQTKSQKKTITATTSFPTEVTNVTEIAAEATVNTPLVNVSSVGPHKNVPLLLSRNTSSSWRNYNGHGQRSSSTLHGSIKRNIPRDNGNSENLTRVREYEFRTESNEENTNGNSRDDASRNEFKRGNRNNTRDSSINRTTTNEEIKQSKDEDIKTGYTTELQNKTKHDARGNETKSRVSVSKHDRRSRGFISKNTVNSDTESIQSKEDYEESYERISYIYTGDKRIPSGSSTVATEDKNVNQELETVESIKELTNLSSALQSQSSILITEDENIAEKLDTLLSKKDLSNLTLELQSSSNTLTTEDRNDAEELETVVSIKDLSNLTLALQGPPKGKVPVVTIFGGYSVARDINGQNKLSEQSIVIHS